jgi:hypothetical protein
VTRRAGHAICDRAVSFLEAVYSPDLALFPYSTNVCEGRYVNDFRREESIRYTINTLLGLQEAARTAGRPEATAVAAAEDAFLERRYGDIRSFADLGLLLVLLRDRLDDPRAVDALRRVDEVVSGPAVRALDMQSLAWMLWGLCAAAPASAAAERLACRLFGTIVSDFVGDSGLPRHSLKRYRRDIVSFGAIVYFLRAMHEFAALMNDSQARRLFENGVERMIRIQGPRGEWPWLTSVRGARSVEFYPVFGVHQDSMAMLFLLPALDAGLPGAGEAISRSFEWVLGANELELPMYAERPFRAYRSIERTDAAPRAARYARALTNVALHRRSTVADGRGVRINPECRSYHLGWILYVWSSRPVLLGELSGDTSVPDAGQPSFA